MCGMGFVSTSLKWNSIQRSDQNINVSNSCLKSSQKQIDFGTHASVCPKDMHRVSQDMTGRQPVALRAIVPERERPEIDSTRLFQIIQLFRCSNGGKMVDRLERFCIRWYQQLGILWATDLLEETMRIDFTIAFGHNVFAPKTRTNSRSSA